MLWCLGPWIREGRIQRFGEEVAAHESHPFLRGIGGFALLLYSQRGAEYRCGNRQWSSIHLLTLVRWVTGSSGRVVNLWGFVRVADATKAVALLGWYYKLQFICNADLFPNKRRRRFLFSQNKGDMIFSLMAEWLLFLGRYGKFGDGG